jgi:hypothetical protein
MLHTKSNVAHKEQCCTQRAMLHTKSNVAHKEQCCTQRAMLHTKSNVAHKEQCCTQRAMLHTNLVKKIKTHFLRPPTLFESRAVYEITWRNILAPDRPQMTI